VPQSEVVKNVYKFVSRKARLKLLIVLSEMK